MTWQEILNDLMPGLPILLLCAAAILVIVVDWFLPARRSYLTGLVALACLGATLALLLGLLLNLAPAWAAHPLQSPAPIFGQRLILDRLGLLLTLLFVTTALATVFVSLQAKPMRGQRSGEYYALLMLATVAMSITAASRDFLVLYLAIETISLPSYVLVGYFRTDRRATEASLKYILYGAVASAVMLFGMSYLYGVTGTTTLPDLYRVAPEKAAALGVGLILLLVGLGFKMALVPFHSWCPDVYEGAPTAITAYLSVASKAAGFAALLRVVYPLYCQVETDQAVPLAIQSIQPWTILLLLAALTMSVGNLIALWQTNLKRLLAYSSIAHAGYMAAAFAVLNREAFEAVLIYLAVYLVMNLGAFFVVLYIENLTDRCDLAVYRGMIHRSPLVAVLFIIFLLSLLGIPPTAGFLAKFKLFGALIKSGSSSAIVLALIAVANVVVSAHYYLRIVKAMVFDPPEDPSPLQITTLGGGLLVVLATAVFFLFVFWTPVQNIAGSIPLNLTEF